MDIVALSKAGPLRNGWERGKGRIYHAVEVGGYDNRDALCGAYPAIMWSTREGDAVTCPRCLRKLTHTFRTVRTETTDINDVAHHQDAWTMTDLSGFFDNPASGFGKPLANLPVSH